MHIDSASLLTNVALIVIGILAVGFLLWFLIALTMEKNGAHVRCRMQFHMDDVSTVAMNRQSIREVDATSSWQETQQVVRPEQMLVTHRALRAVGHTAKSALADESWQSGPYLIH